MPSPFYNESTHYKLKMLKGDSKVHDIGTGFQALGEGVDAALYKGGVGVSAWTKITFLGSKLEGQAEGRFENSGKTARLRGSLAVKSGEELKSGEDLISLLPSSLIPAAEYNSEGYIVLPTLTGATFVFLVLVDGEVRLVGGPLVAKTVIELGSATYPIA